MSINKFFSSLLLAGLAAASLRASDVFLRSDLGAVSGVSGMASDPETGDYFIAESLPGGKSRIVALTRAGRNPGGKQSPVATPEITGTVIGMAAHRLVINGTGKSCVYVALLGAHQAPVDGRVERWDLAPDGNLTIGAGHNIPIRQNGALTGNDIPHLRDVVVSEFGEVFAAGYYRRNGSTGVPSSERRYFVCRFDADLKSPVERIWGTGRTDFDPAMSLAVRNGTLYVGMQVKPEPGWFVQEKESVGASSNYTTIDKVLAEEALWKGSGGGWMSPVGGPHVFVNIWNTQMNRISWNYVYKAADPEIPDNFDFTGYAYPHTLVNSSPNTRNGFSPSYPKVQARSEISGASMTRASGWLRTDAGVHSFQTYTSGIRFQVDGKDIFGITGETVGESKPRTHSGEIELTAGIHKVELIHGNTGGRMITDLKWKRPRQETYEFVPAMGVISVDEATGSGSGLRNYNPGDPGHPSGPSSPAVPYPPDGRLDTINYMPTDNTATAACIVSMRTGFTGSETAMLGWRVLPENDVAITKMVASGGYLYALASASYGQKKPVSVIKLSAGADLSILRKATMKATAADVELEAKSLAVSDGRVFVAARYGGASLSLVNADNSGTGQEFGSGPHYLIGQLNEEMVWNSSTRLVPPGGSVSGINTPWLAPGGGSLGIASSVASGGGLTVGNSAPGATVAAGTAFFTLVSSDSLRISEEITLSVEAKAERRSADGSVFVTSVPIDWRDAPFIGVTHGAENGLYVVEMPEHAYVSEGADGKLHAVQQSGVPEAEFKARVGGAAVTTRFTPVSYTLTRDDDSQVVSGTGRSVSVVLTKSTAITFTFRTEHSLIVNSLVDASLPVADPLAGFGDDSNPLKNTGTPEPFVGKHWIEENALVSPMIDGATIRFDLPNSRLLAGGYIATGTASKAAGGAAETIVWPEVTARQQITQFALTGPATVSYLLRTQFGFTSAASNSAAGSLPIVRVFGNPDRDYEGSGTVWVDRGASVFIGARDNPATAIAMRGVVAATGSLLPLYENFGQSGYLETIHGTAISSSEGKRFNNVQDGGSITWDYGDKIYRQAVRIGDPVAFNPLNPGDFPDSEVMNGVIINTIDKNTAPAVLSILDAPPGSTADDMQIWDAVEHKCYPLRPGRFLLEWKPLPPATKPVITEIVSGFSRDRLTHLKANPGRYFGGSATASARDYRCLLHADLPAIKLTTDSVAFLKLAFSTTPATDVSPLDLGPPGLLPSVTDGTLSFVFSDGQLLGDAAGKHVLVFTKSVSGAPSGDKAREPLAVRVLETRPWNALSDWNDAATPVAMSRTSSTPAIIGQKLVDSTADTAGIHTGFIVNPNARYNPEIYDRSLVEDAGPIIPVNKVFPAAGDTSRDLTVIWYERGDGILWPWRPVTYATEWPAPGVPVLLPTPVNSTASSEASPAEKVSSLFDGAPILGAAAGLASEFAGQADATLIVRLDMGATIAANSVAYAQRATVSANQTTRIDFWFSDADPGLTVPLTAPVPVAITNTADSKVTLYDFPGGAMTGRYVLMRFTGTGNQGGGELRLARNPAFDIPSDGGRIVIASRTGSEGLINVAGKWRHQAVFEPAKYSNVKLYNQPDPALPGYNPNEEHALIASSFRFASSANPPPAAFALRTRELNVRSHDTAYTSDPFVLVQYFDEQLQEPAMAVYSIAAEDAAVLPLSVVIAGADISSGTGDAITFRMPGTPLIDGEAVNIDFSGVLDGLSSGGVYYVSAAASTFSLTTYPGNPPLTGRAPESGTVRPAVTVRRIHNATFNYPMKAGEPVQAPYPLGLVIGLTPPAEISGLNGWTGDGSAEPRTFWKDVRGQAWAISGGSSAQEGRLRAYYYYPMKADFWYGLPGGSQVDAGTSLRFLPPAANISSEFAASKEKPQEIKYRVTWPDNPAVLKAGETLTYAGGEYKADHPDGKGLPGIIGWASGRIVYDSKNATMNPDTIGTRYGARIIAPLETRVASIATARANLDKIGPATGLTETDGLVWRIAGLPASLKKRISIDPVSLKLKLNGFVNDRTLGDGDLTAAPPPVYVLEPNILTRREYASLLDVEHPDTHKKLLTELPAGVWLRAVKDLYRVSRDPAVCGHPIPRSATFPARWCRQLPTIPVLKPR